MVEKQKSKKRVLYTEDLDDDDDDEEDATTSIRQQSKQIQRQRDLDEQNLERINRKYSLEKYRNLLEYFRDVQVLTPDSPQFIVEKIRNLAEFLVYG